MEIRGSSNRHLGDSYRVTDTVGISQLILFQIHRRVVMVVYLWVCLRINAFLKKQFFYQQNQDMVCLWVLSLKKTVLKDTPDSDPRSFIYTFFYWYLVILSSARIRVGVLTKTIYQRIKVLKTDCVGRRNNSGK